MKNRQGHTTTSGYRTGRNRQGKAGWGLAVALLTCVAPAGAKDGESDGLNGLMLQLELPTDFGIRLRGARIDHNGIASPDERWGQRVAGIGDVNGDGIDDIAVASPDAGRSHIGPPVPGMPIQLPHGGVIVVYGRNEPLDIDLDALGEGGFRIVGGENEQAGYRLSAAGDVNGDGLADLVVAAPKFVDFQESANYVVFGKRDGGTVELGALAAGGSGQGFRIGGGDTGYSVSAAGDLNGDGYDDLLVGHMPSETPIGLPPDALIVAHVVYGKADDLPVDMTALGTGGFHLFCSNDPLPNEYCQVEAIEQLAGVGDVNGDGRPDLAVGFGREMGVGYVVFSPDSPRDIDLNQLGKDGFRIRDAQHVGELGLGFVVSAAGDVNGDGLGDVMFSSRNNRYVFVVYGAASTADLNPFALGDRGFYLHSSEIGSRFGEQSLAGLGDITGDGLADLMIGAAWGGTPNVGTAYVVMPGARHTPILIGDPGTPVLALLGEQDGSEAGHSVSGAGDFNGDGYADLLIGAPSTRPFLEDPDNLTGTAYVFMNPTDVAVPMTEYRSTARSTDDCGTGLPTPLTRLTAIGTRRGAGADQMTPESRLRLRYCETAASGDDYIALPTVTLYQGQPLAWPIEDDATPLSVNWMVAFNAEVEGGEAIVSVRYTDNEIAGLAEETLALYWYDPATGLYRRFSNSVPQLRDVSRNTLTVRVPIQTEPLHLVLASRTGEEEVFANGFECHAGAPGCG